VLHTQQTSFGFIKQDGVSYLRKVKVLASATLTQLVNGFEKQLAITTKERVLCKENTGSSDELELC
jgi:hypothetical protein